MRRLLRLMKDLFWTDRGITAISNIFLVRFATEMLVDMASVRHSLCKRKFLRTQSVSEVDVEKCFISFAAVSKL